MSMSLAMARMIVNGGGTSPTGPVPQYEPGDGSNPFDTGGDGGSAPPGGGTNSGSINLPTFDNSAGDIGVMPPGFEPITGFPGYYYNPDTNEVKSMTDTRFDSNGTPVATFHTLTKAERAAFNSAYAKFAQNGGATGGGGASGSGVSSGGGSDHYATDASTANAAANRAEQAREYDRTFGENQRQYDLTHGLAENQYDQSVLGNRNSGGLSVAGLANTLAENAYARAKDPGNFPALLASYSGMEPGDVALTTLLGQGYQIPETPGSNPLADPRFQKLMDSLYTYGTGPSPEQINNVRMAREQLGDQQARIGFQNFANLDAQNQANQQPQVKAATGADFTTTGPTNILAGEGGAPEHVTVTPENQPMSPAAMYLRNYAGLGTEGQKLDASGKPYTPGGTDLSGLTPTGSGLAPASRLGTMAEGGVDTVRQIAAQNGGVLPQAFYDYTHTVNPNATSGQSYTPAQGTAVALYKALKPFGYAPREVMDALQRGNAPGPNMIAGKFGDRLQNENPSLYRMLMAAVQARLGSAGLGDYLAQGQRYEQAGFNGTGSVVR